MVGKYDTLELLFGVRQTDRRHKAEPLRPPSSTVNSDTTSTWSSPLILPVQVNGSSHICGSD
jgi:hypothetical protein